MAANCSQKMFLLHQLFWKKSYDHKRDTLGLVLMTNDNVDNENLFFL